MQNRKVVFLITFTFISSFQALDLHDAEYLEFLNPDSSDNANIYNVKMDARRLQFIQRS